MSLSITVQGEAETIAALQDLSRQVQRRMIDRAARAALKPVVATARAGVPRDTGNLRKSIGVKKSRRTRKGEIVLSVGPRPGFDWKDEKGKLQVPWRYAIPVEYGHLTKGGASYVAPVGFLRAAYHQHRLTIISDFAVELKARIERWKR